MDEHDLRRGFHQAYDGTRPPADAADRAFERVAADGGTYGAGRRLAGAAAVALAALLVLTLMLGRQVLTAPRSPAPALQSAPVRTATQTPDTPAPPSGSSSVQIGTLNEAPPEVLSATGTMVAMAGWSGATVVELTTDGGATWTAVPAPPGRLADIELVDDDTAIVATGLGLYRFQRSTLAWTRVSTRPDLVRLDFFDRTSGWAVTAGGDVLETGDGGATLLTHNVGLHPVSWIQWVSDTKAWAVGPGGIVATRDGGATWASQLAFPAPAGRPGSVGRAQVGFRDEANGFAVFDLAGPGMTRAGFVVYHTADGGATWTAEGCTCGLAALPSWLRQTAAPSLPRSAEHSDLVVTAPSTAMFVSPATSSTPASICTTTDAGRDWSCGTAPYRGGGAAALAARGRTWWLVADGGGAGPLFGVSPDAGTTWTVSHP